jgi:hypothetical protein
MNDFFSDRQRGPKARTEENLSPVVWGGVVAIIQALISNGAFGYTYPDACPDGTGVSGADEQALSLAIKAEIPELDWPRRTMQEVGEGYFREPQPYVPDTFVAFDCIEFVYRAIAKPIQGDFTVISGITI